MQHSQVLIKTQKAGRAMHKHHTITAFTLVEMIVVVVILGVLSGMMFIRLSGDIRRRLDYTTVQVNNLLETLAYRQSISQDQLALSWLPDQQTLQLDRLRIQEQTQNPAWEKDPLTAAVVFKYDDIILADLRFDGEHANLSDETRIELPLDDVRPVIAIEVQWGDAEQTELFELLPHALKSVRTGIGSDNKDYPEPFDLDEAGMGDNSW